MKTIVHVNQHIIKANARTGANDPPLTVKTYKDQANTHEAIIKCPHCGGAAAAIVYRPEHPLACGARVWIETFGQVKGFLTGMRHLVQTTNEGSE